MIFYVDVPSARQKHTAKFSERCLCLLCNGKSEQLAGGLDTGDHGAKLAKFASEIAVAAASIENSPTCNLS